MKLNRRTFFRQSTMGGVGLFALHPTALSESSNKRFADEIPGHKPNSSLAIPEPRKDIVQKKVLDLTPARWIWFPSKRTLANTFVLFRKEININKSIKNASGWILGDSRYLLEVNGQRIQWGPAPSDPRWMEADPVDLTDMLKPGENVLGATVLFFGHGDGTWPIGKPGFIFHLSIQYSDGSKEKIVTDNSWHCHIPRCWHPGQYKRWYLRALQEEFDARFYPYGWS